MEREQALTKITTLDEVLKCINDGTVLMYGGFGGIGNPPTLIDGILKKGVHNLFLIGNDTGFPDVGVGRLVTAGRVKKIITSHIGSNPVAGELMHQGILEVEFSPQGTLAERIRAGGMGLGGILTDVGIGTVVEEGKRKITIDSKEYLLETALTAEVAIVHADKADTFGNLTYMRSGRNFSPLVAMAADITIAEANEIVPLGSLDPETIVTPGVYVDMIIQSEGVNWKWAWELTKEAK